MVKTLQIQGTKDTFLLSTFDNKAWYPRGKLDMSKTAHYFHFSSSAHQQCSLHERSARAGGCF